MPASSLPIPYHQVKYFVCLSPSYGRAVLPRLPLPHTFPPNFSQFQILPSPLPLSDQATRENATHKLEQASRENYVRRTFYSSFHRTHLGPPLSLTHAPLRTQPGYMHTLASELANEASPVFVRNAAGLALKNALTARVRRAVPHSFPRSSPSPSIFHVPDRAPTGQRASGRVLDPLAWPRCQDPQRDQRVCPAWSSL